MSPRYRFKQPFWLFRLLDNAYYVGANTLTDQTWNTIFRNLSKYSELHLDSFGIDDDDAKTRIRGRLACLLPDSNSQYGPDQISVWRSLRASPLTVSNDNLQKVVDMENSRYPSLSEHNATSGSRGFFVCSWRMSVSEFDILFNHMNKEEKTFHELITWDTFIANYELEPDDRITIRYIGSCALSEWPINLTANICEQIDDDRSGILDEFLSAVVSALPTVAKTYQCHLIKHIKTSAKDKEGFHELVHSILIEFFGTSFVLNRHPDSKTSECLTKRMRILDSLNLRFDHSALDRLRLECPDVLSKLEVHFNKMKGFVALNREATGTCDNTLQLHVVRRNNLLNQSVPSFYRRNRAIVVIAARGMHINEYKHGISFTPSRDPANRLLCQILSGGKNLYSPPIYVAPFAYYCLIPWPKPSFFGDAVVTFGKEMAACVVRKCGPQGIYTTDAYLTEIGQPVIRRINKNSFIHVPLLDPSRCRYGIEYVNMAALKFMQTSFWNAMLVADKVMQVLDNAGAIESEMAVQTDSEKGCSDTDSSLSGEDKHCSAGTVVREPAEVDESEAICRLAMQSYRELFSTRAGRAFSIELDKDFRGLDDVVEKEPLFIP
ncbi:hypothetical protein FHL15_005114 [Xylaria flabelliformis]|uniref:Uncharacterized protein n=1 Tax=Xylaria flabelliformis TaxID=2512241 RepID=A0A553I1E7_9PEZI|nr:hypothetical protein FHL15_005114 [Xylaria flabelliformis]